MAHGKELPAMQDIRVRSLGQEDLLKKKMATHSRILAWKKFHGRKIQKGYSPLKCSVATVHGDAESWTQLTYNNTGEQITKEDGHELMSSCQLLDCP